MLRMNFRVILIVFSLGALGGCALSGEDYYQAVPPEAYPAADGPGERLQPDEAETAARLAAVIKEHLTNLYTAHGVPVRRDAHPKLNGCAKAEFVVRDDLPAALRHGVFQPGARYRALLRFSNANEDPTRADGEDDGRGLAIKLIGVDGEFLSPAVGDRGTQDFIMINHPVFFINDAKDYLRLVGLINADDFVTSRIATLLTPFVIGLEGTLIALDINSDPISNPLATRYFSMTPYQLGDGPGALAIKFSVFRSTDYAQVAVNDADDDYLRAALDQSLRASAATMVFAVQVRSGPHMAVEDVQTAWSEEEAPFIPVATLRLPQQATNTEQRDAACRDAAYNPWKGLAEHRPLGGVNRVRKVVYDQVGAMRRSRNGAALTEPTPSDFDRLP